MKSLESEALKKMGDLNSAQLTVGTMFSVEEATKGPFALAYELWAAIWVAHYHNHTRKAVA